MNEHNARTKARGEKMARLRGSITDPPPPLATVPFELSASERVALKARVWADAQRRLAENEEDMVIAELVRAIEESGETISDEEIFDLMDGEGDDTHEIDQGAELGPSGPKPEPALVAPPEHWTDALPYTFFGRHV